jgi:hypothetical protein
MCEGSCGHQSGELTGRLTLTVTIVPLSRPYRTPGVIGSYSHALMDYMRSRGGTVKSCHGAVYARSIVCSSFPSNPPIVSSEVGRIPRRTGGRKEILGVGRNKQILAPSPRKGPGEGIILWAHQVHVILYPLCDG